MSMTKISVSSVIKTTSFSPVVAKSSAVWQIVESASPEQLITSFPSSFKYCDSILINWALLLVLERSFLEWTGQLCFPSRRHLDISGNVCLSVFALLILLMLIRIHQKLCSTSHNAFVHTGHSFLQFSWSWNLLPNTLDAAKHLHPSHKNNYFDSM